MAGVDSAVGDRHALHLVYYSAMKKTVTRLDDVYSAVAQHMRRASHDTILQRDVALTAPTAR